jgi:hypothetical protein
VAARKSREKRLTGIDLLRSTRAAKRRTLQRIQEDRMKVARENAIFSEVLAQIGELSSYHD